MQAPVLTMAHMSRVRQVRKFLESDDEIQFNSFAAAIYRFGLKGQLLLASSPSSSAKTLTVAASHRKLWEEMHRTVGRRASLRALQRQGRR